MSLSITRDIELTECRCWDCGRTYAYEQWGGGNRECPYCAGRKLSELHHEVDALRRSNRSFAAAATKRRTKKGDG